MAKKKPPYDDPELGFNKLADDPVAWFEQSRLPYDQQSPWFRRSHYPSERIRDHYLDPTNRLVDRDVRDLLRALLPDGTGVVGSDERNFDHGYREIGSRIKSGEATEYERRLIKSMLGRKPNSPYFPAAPVPDLTWIVDLAFDHPTQAFDVANAYLDVHFRVLNDQIINGMLDFMATVRCYFMNDASRVADVSLLRSLPPRSLEYLVAALWARLGYDTAVTKVTRDGGKDVIATRQTPGKSETVLIECRQWRERVPVGAPRELYGILGKDRANKGIIVAPGGFTHGSDSAAEFANEVKTVELVDGSQLAALMTESYGPRWPIEIDRYVQAGRRHAENS